MNKYCLIILTASGLFFGPGSLALAQEGMIRTTGDTTGISFSEQTKNARPINGNVRGVTFSQWVTGFRDNIDREQFFYTKPKSSRYFSKQYRDTTRVLSSEDPQTLNAIIQPHSEELISK